MIENTSKRDPFTHLVGSMDNPSGYITDMEAAGQQQLVNSDQLPTEAPWERLEEFGFKRGEVVSGDPLFTHCTLPEGWRREGTDHAMHSSILDERGVKRVQIFYKAAFYDRRADAYVINVGFSLVTDVVFGNGPVKLPDEWLVLTEKERADFILGLQAGLDREWAADKYDKRAREAMKLIES